jgi:hypothetical protein
MLDLLIVIGGGVIYKRKCFFEYQQLNNYLYYRNLDATMSEMSLSAPTKPLFQVKVNGARTPGKTSIPCSAETRKAMKEYRVKYEEMYGEQKAWDPILMAMTRVPISFVGIR